MSGLRSLSEDVLHMQEAKRRPRRMKYGDGLGSLVGDGAIKTERSWVTLGFPGHMENFGYHPKNNRKPSKSVSKRGPRSDLHVTSIILATVLKIPKEGQAWRWEAAGRPLLQPVGQVAVTVMGQASGREVGLEGKFGRYLGSD